MLQASTAPQDTDHDGMPDASEKEHGLDVANAADRAKLGPGRYPWLEVYLDELAEGWRD